MNDNHLDITYQPNCTIINCKTCDGLHGLYTDDEGTMKEWIKGVKARHRDCERREEI